VRKIQPDVILCTDKRTFWLPVVRRAACRYALFMHGEDVASCIKDRNPLSRAILKKLLSGAVWTFFNSTYSLSLAKGAGLVERASAVGCGFLPEDIVEEDRRAEARQRLGWSDGPVLLTVSRLVLRKGIDTVMRAMGIVLRVFPNCRYAVVGAGPDRAELESLARELGLVDKVDFMGRVSEETKRLVYLASDLYVMPSRPGSRGEVEGFGISFLEANAHGLAVVGSRAGGIPDAVEDGANGVLVPPSDPAALGEAIVMLLADPPRRRGMALVGQKRIRERFNWKSIVDKIEEKLCSAAGGR
jgi:phosphatidylinositol alpha-1,6-mannosyltransferase